MNELWLRLLIIWTYATNKPSRMTSICIQLQRMFRGGITCTDSHTWFENQVHIWNQYRHANILAPIYPAYHAMLDPVTSIRCGWSLSWPCMKPACVVNAQVTIRRHLILLLAGANVERSESTWRNNAAAASECQRERHQINGWQQGGGAPCENGAGGVARLHLQALREAVLLELQTAGGRDQSACGVLVSTTCHVYLCNIYLCTCSALRRMDSGRKC